jgi:hypothetical protein
VVGRNEDLTVAGGAGADADGGYADRARDARRGGRGDLFEHEREDARVFERFRVALERRCFVVRGAAHLIRPAAALQRPASKDVRMNWARRLKRVFGIEIEQCMRCGGRLKVIASIQEPELIERILAHRRERGGEGATTVSLGARRPPQLSLG